MDWITDHIAIGNFKDARSAPDEITQILCLKAGCTCDERETVVVTRVPLVDGPGNRADDVRTAVACIAAAVGDGDKILVHCHAGQSRSVVVVARYLMAAEGLSKSAAMGRVTAKRAAALAPGILTLLDTEW